jgi:chaperonin GroEL
MIDNLIFGKEAIDGVMRGVKKVADAVGATMGTFGKNSLIETFENPGISTTNDGATIVDAIKFADPLEEIGRKIIREAVSRANKASGDGSSTTCVLTSAILEEGRKYLDKFSPMDIKNSLEKCIPLLEKSLKEQSKKITLNEVSKVATISSEDEGIGNMIQEIYKKIGKDGVISWDISKTAEDGYTIGTGITIHGATYVSPYMCDVDALGRFMNGIIWKEPKILLAKQKIMSNDDLNTILSSLFTKNIKELVIFCEEIEMPVVASLVKTRIERGFKTMVVKMPVLWRDEWWEDLAQASGGKIIDGIGKSLSNVTDEDLGQFSHITITKEDTYIDGINDLSEHIEALRKDGSDSALQRAGRLNTKTARYFVGAYSDQALYYRRLKVEDAINASSCALENGIVVGGGIALINSTKNLLLNEIGGKIMAEVLKEPFNRIVKNFGKEPNKLKVGGKKCFNSRTGKVEDLMKKGIVNPVDVEINAVKNAIGVAASILTIGNVVLLSKEESHLMPQNQI